MAASTALSAAARAVLAGHVGDDGAGGKGHDLVAKALSVNVRARARARGRCVVARGRRGRRAVVRRACV